MQGKANDLSANTLDAQNPLLLEATGLGLALNGKTLLADVSLTLGKGELAYLIGRTGSGKSSLLRLLYADLRPTTGALRVENFAVSHMPANQVPLLRRRLGIVFQDFQLLPEATVADNVTFAMRATGWADGRKIKNRLTEVLMLVGLSAKQSHYPHQLSGGEQQRAAIARALVNDPVLVLADEPTGNLDPEVAQHILDILGKVHRAGTAVLMATHNYEHVRRLPGRVLEMRDGHLTDRGHGAQALPAAAASLAQQA